MEKALQTMINNMPEKTGKSLGNSGPFGTMCTHRVKLSAVEEVDQELINWLKEAYQKAD